MKPRLLALAALVAAALPALEAEPRAVTIGVIAKSQSNPVFQAARVGAEDAARDLGAKLHLAIRIDWRTPNDEDAQKQAQAIEQLVLSGADGIAVSCSDANKLTDAINAAVDHGVPVATFDSDAPASRRFVTCGIDDEKCGETVMDCLARIMNGKGVVAILAGSQNAPNLQKRLRGALAAAARYPGITVRGAYYNKETPQDAAAKVEQVMEANPDIGGWAMVAAAVLFTENALPWQADAVKCVAMDALPPELAYLRSGQVQALFAQQCYQWGYRSVELLVDRIVFNRTPPAVKEVSPLLKVDRGNLDAFAKNWETWLRP
jgi:ribose transport system substrate-binding protein